MPCGVIWGTFGCLFGLFLNDFGESVGCRVYPTCTYKFLVKHDLDATLNKKWAESLRLYAGFAL